MTREQPGDAKLRTEGSGLDLDALEKVARAATPGPWRPEARGLCALVMAEKELQLLSTSWHASHRRHYPLEEESVNNAVFATTFDPPTVLRLIETQRELVAALEIAAQLAEQIQHGNATPNGGAKLIADNSRAAIAKAVGQ